MGSGDLFSSLSQSRTCNFVEYEAHCTCRIWYDHGQSFISKVKSAEEFVIFVGIEWDEIL